MCGIAGAVGPLDPDVLAAVERMDRAQVHRGPDGHGSWTGEPDAAGRGAAFAHRRLAIIDLSPDAAQPMVDPETGHVIVYNGEIYNFRELRRDLEAEGSSFRSRCDTEVLLRGYARWGVEVLARLRGMFAFALWDADEKKVLLARDRLGIKPLYYSCQGSLLLFASEVRSLLASGRVERRLDPVGLSSYLWNGFVVGPHTILAAVRALEPGQYAWIDPGSARPETTVYWTLPEMSGRGIDDAEELATELRSAVRERLVSDVPLGVFLSGGVDSSAVTALAAGGGEHLKTFNVSFTEQEYDESRYARAVADALGTDHHEILLRQEDFANQLPDAFDAIDQPTFDALNSYFVSRAVREAGLVVALAGTGGDEVFGGYRSFTEVPRAARIARGLAWLPRPLLRALGGTLTRLKTGKGGEVPPQTRWGKVTDLLLARGDRVATYQTAYALFTGRFLGELADPALLRATRAGLPPGRFEELQGLIEGLPGERAVTQLELSLFLGERLLRDTDAASMAVSLEVRVPLIDHRVVEAAAALAVPRRYHPPLSKALLRELALAELDPRIFEREKSGFVLPLADWSRDQLAAEVEETFRDDSLTGGAGLHGESLLRLWRAFRAGAPGLYYSRIWSLYVLLRWCREHGAHL